MKSPSRIQCDRGTCAQAVRRCTRETLRGNELGRASRWDLERQGAAQCVMRSGDGGTRTRGRHLPTTP